LGQQLSDRFATLVEHLKKVGSALGRAMDSYNAAVGSFEHQLLPSARRFKDLGAVGKKEIEKLELVDKTPRAFADPDEE
jgi:DNA recombination protein RmuC